MTFTGRRAVWSPLWCGLQVCGYCCLWTTAVCVRTCQPERWVDLLKCLRLRSSMSVHFLLLSLLLVWVAVFFCCCCECYFEIKRRFLRFVVEVIVTPSVDISIVICSFTPAWLIFTDDNNILRHIFFCRPARLLRLPDSLLSDSINSCMLKRGH